MVVAAEAFYKFVTELNLSQVEQAATVLKTGTNTLSGDRVHAWRFSSPPLACEVDLLHSVWLPKFHMLVFRKQVLWGGTIGLLQQFWACLLSKLALGAFGSQVT
eukprot:6401637-Amphidinium_carterae.1